MKDLNLTTIPIFFASDKNYLPYLSVAMRSLIDNASKNYNYEINILNNGIDGDKVDLIKAMQADNVEIEFINVNKKVLPLSNKLNLRDYYTKAIYYRLFIPSMFSQYNKAIYLDSDIVVLGDISELFNINLKDNLLGTVPDQIVDGNKVFRKYSQVSLGLDHRKYFNSGVLLMNLDLLRKEHIETKFVSLLKKYNFDTIAPDQDYLNYLCKNKVLYLDKCWNKECTRAKAQEDIKIIHYALYKKPWLYTKVKYKKYFWEYAKRVEFYKEIVSTKKLFKRKHKKEHKIAYHKLIEHSLKIINSEDTFYKTLAFEDLDLQIMEMKSNYEN